MAAWNALSTNVYPEFAGIAITNHLDGSLSLTGAAGAPFTVTLAALEPDGTPAVHATFTQTTPVAASGPTFWSEPRNWSTGSVPAGGDDVVIQNSAASILYGLDQSSITLNSLSIDQSFTGTIGLPRTNVGGYVEYRLQYLQIKAPTITIGAGAGAGSGRIKLDTLAGETLLSVLNSGSPAESGIKSILWKGTHAGQHGDGEQRQFWRGRVRRRIGRAFYAQSRLSHERGRRLRRAARRRLRRGDDHEDRRQPGDQLEFQHARALGRRDDHCRGHARYDDDHRRLDPLSHRRQLHAGHSGRRRRARLSPRPTKPHWHEHHAPCRRCLPRPVEDGHLHQSDRAGLLTRRSHARPGRQLQSATNVSPGAALHPFRSINWPRRLDLKPAVSSLMPLAPQGLASFPGVNQLVDASISLVPGISPAVATLTIAPQLDFTAQVGTLSFSFGGVAHQLSGLQGRLQQLRAQCRRRDLAVVDRRSALAMAFRSDILARTTCGATTSRSTEARTAPSTPSARRNNSPRCVSTRWGESGYDVSDLPNITRPSVEWDYDVPAEALRRRCAISWAAASYCNSTIPWRFAASASAPRSI